MFEIFIRRPILSGVISVVIVFLGLLAINYRLRGCSDDHGRHDYQSRYGRWSYDPSPIGIV